MADQTKRMDAESYTMGQQLVAVEQQAHLSMQLKSAYRRREERKRAAANDELADTVKDLARAAEKRTLINLIANT